MPSKPSNGDFNKHGATVVVVVVLGQSCQFHLCMCMYVIINVCTPVSDKRSFLGPAAKFSAGRRNRYFSDRLVRRASLELLSPRSGGRVGGWGDGGGGS